MTELYDRSQALLQGIEREEKRLYGFEKSLLEIQRTAYESLFTSKSKLSHAKGEKRIRELQERISEIESLIYDVNLNLKGVAVSLYEMESHRKKVLEIDLQLPTC